MEDNTDSRRSLHLSVGELAQIACLLEATARKPGNVHRTAEYDDALYIDFVLSAVVVGAVLTRAVDVPVGEVVLECVRRTRETVGTNTNLGIVLLLAPLAAVPTSCVLRDGLLQVLSRLTVNDASAVYEAIRLINPGGLGSSPQQDVWNEPNQTLLEVMQIARSRDLIARQYSNGFKDVFDDGVPTLARSFESGTDWERAIVRCHLELMLRHPDTLISRKCGEAEAKRASQFAGNVLAAGWPETDRSLRIFNEFDMWLRATGHQRNPGATADLVVASLFVALREGTIRPPVKGFRLHNEV